MDTENEVLSLSLQEYAEMEEERKRKMPEKGPMTVAARIDDTPVLFKSFFVSEKPSESLFFIPESRVLVKDKALIKNEPVL